MIHTSAILLLSLFLGFSSCAQPARGVTSNDSGMNRSSLLTKPIIEFLQKKAVTISKDNPSPVTDWSAIHNHMKNKRIVLLGEFTHGAKEIFIPITVNDTFIDLANSNKLIPSKQFDGLILLHTVSPGKSFE